ncbi:MAG: 1-deoxy-D-xylulose-5-phosphate reductoisomerase [Candidatus Omnitrophica bacterium]|nr:1-deoxy-D-xylulose-5-phosphate reductoisomerase [Candidatus Omnitrophota bacterium]MBU1905806.1 1-deoxy-D-xylulose-5-phosphate reductoisomerase [Candidatus Omnitrophota bacterium]
MKNIAILGSTGSIGENTLAVIRNHPDKFKIIALSTNSKIDILERQIKEFDPLFVCVRNRQAAERLKVRLRPSIKLFEGEKGLHSLVKQKRVELVLLAISGSAALSPLLKAIEAKKRIALANKEALVMAGPIIMAKAREKKVKILPIDSELSAIWQCLTGKDQSRLKNIYLTASGGPFRQASAKDLRNITVARVIKHPRWKMGRKISVDSATLMNKGLELLETMFLFGIPCNKIKILIHPEAIVHSMVEFVDGVVIAQLSATDMRIPIQYALSYPRRLENKLPGIDFYKLKELNFQKPDFRKFPCLELAYRAAKKLGTAPCVLNAANEVVVEEFLQNKLDFISIPKVIKKVLDKHRNNSNPNLSDIRKAYSWARAEAYRVIGNLKNRKR